MLNKLQITELQNMLGELEDYLPHLIESGDMHTYRQMEYTERALKRLVDDMACLLDEARGKL